MSADVVSTVGAGVGRIGRYFSVVSAMPAAVFTAYVYLVLRATDWFEPLDWKRLGNVRLQDLVVLGIVALVVALALNPLQFPLIQLFEGYWGANPIAIQLALLRTAHHRRRRQRLLALSSNAGLSRPQETAGEPAAGSDNLRDAIVLAESQRLRSAYPELSRILPTRLGNVLRRYEDGIALPYGLDPLVTIPRLAMLAGERESAYVENQRVQLELAVRTTFLALLATPITAVALMRSGFWLLLACVPYAVAFLAYRGSVALAHEYGTSLAVMTDLTRFTLYDRLRLQSPATTAKERDANTKLMELFGLSTSEPSLRYSHPASAASDQSEPSAQPAVETPQDS